MSAQTSLGLFPHVLRSAGERLIERAASSLDAPLGLRNGHRHRPVAATQPSVISIPSDLLVGAWRDLFPAERMAFLAGRHDGNRLIVTSVRNVTGENRSSVYVRASETLLGQALVDWSACGAHVIGWIHSHPGWGPGASCPSSIDRHQDEDLRAAFGKRLIGLIGTHDGWLRLWGRALATEPDLVRFEGKGITATEERHVYRLKVR